MKVTILNSMDSHLPINISGEIFKVPAIASAAASVTAPARPPAIASARQPAAPAIIPAVSIPASLPVKDPVVTSPIDMLPDIKL